MNLDELDVFTPQPAVVPTPRKCRRHQWVAERGHPFTDEAGSEIAPGTLLGYRCARCFVIRDETAARRGKSARRLGGDTERRIERVYGPVKIGERGDPVDHIGRVWKWQSKATREAPPAWLAGCRPSCDRHRPGRHLAAVTEPTPRDVSAAIAAAWNRMTGLYGGRRGVVIRSFVSRGVRTRDWLFIDAHDGVAEFGYDTLPYVTGWWVIPGDWWLDHFGRDE